MESLITWREPNEFIDFKSTKYCAYIDSNRNVILSKTLCDENGVIKFKNQLLTCRQLKLWYNISDRYSLHAIFENGEVEIINTLKNKPTLKLLKFSEPILKIDEFTYTKTLITLSVSGTLKFNGSVILANLTIIDFKVFYKKLVLYHRDGSIKLYSVDRSNEKSIKITCCETPAIQLVNDNLYNIKHLLFVLDVLLLSLYSGEIVCSTHFELIKKLYTTVSLK